MKNKKVLIGIIALVVIISVGIVALAANDPVRPFTQAIEKGDYTYANSIYNEDIKGDYKKESKAMDSLIKIFENTQKLHEQEKQSYLYAFEQAMMLSEYEMIYDQINEIFDEMTDLETVRESYALAQTAIDSVEYKEAISELEQVLEIDPEYEDASSQLDEIKIAYKTALLDEVENSSDYVKTLESLDEALEVFPDENSLLSLRDETFNKIKNECEQDQLVVVTGAKIYEQDSYTAPYFVELIIENRHTETIKDYEISYLGYDKNGYPVLLDDEYLRRGISRSANVLSGQFDGKDSGYALDDGGDAKYIIGCIETATFFDGYQWVNPYYTYWTEAFVEKPIDVEELKKLTYSQPDQVEKTADEYLAFISQPVDAVIKQYGDPTEVNTYDGYALYHYPDVAFKVLISDDTERINGFFYAGDLSISEIKLGMTIEEVHVLTGEPFDGSVDDNDRLTLIYKYNSMLFYIGYGLESEGYVQYLGIFEDL